MVDAARLEAPSRPGWLWMLVKPAGGIVHAKLLLFRTAGGLRVGITGSNLMGSAQWESIRDAIWVQDFDVARASPGQLWWTVPDVCGSADWYSAHGAEAPRLVECLFDGMDFAWAAASLVVSMPVPAPPPPPWWLTPYRLAPPRPGCTRAS